MLTFYYQECFLDNNSCVFCLYSDLDHIDQIGFYSFFLRFSRVNKANTELIFIDFYLCESKGWGNKSVHILSNSIIGVSIPDRRMLIVFTCMFFAMYHKSNKFEKLIGLGLFRFLSGQKWMLDVLYLRDVLVG